MDDATVAATYLRGEPIRGEHRAYAISQLVGAIMTEVPDWTEEGILDACHRLNQLRLQPNLDDDRVRICARRTIEVLRRRSWREIELRSWLDQSAAHLDRPDHTIDSDRQLLLIGQTIDELIAAGHAAETILREIQIFNARYFAPPLDPDILRHLVWHMLRRCRAA